jgi:hypothetical protein
MLHTRRSQKTYTYVYWPDIDDLSHRFGPYDRRVRLEFDSFGQLFGPFLQELAALKGSTLLIVTADHGQIPTPIDPRFDIQRVPGILDCLTILPAGEARMPYLYLRPGRAELLAELIQRQWGSEFTFMPSEQALQAGLFGAPVHPQAAQRVGDCLLIANGSGYWFWSKKENSMKARHGGLSREEMLVPFLTLEI